ncbi:signal transducer and activator of transcription 5B-like [Arapaima gigas]
MAQWEKVKCLPTQVLSDLYPSQFPMEVRYYLASWIEEQHWDDFDVDDPNQEAQALQLLEQIVSFLQDMAHQKSNVVERLRLQHIAVNMSVFRSQPILLVKTVQDILRQERELLIQMGTPSSAFAGSSAPQPCSPVCSPLSAGSAGRDEGCYNMDLLVLKVLDLQSCREQIHRLQKDLHSERQTFESMLVQQRQSNGVDLELPEQVQKLQTNIQQVEFNVQALFVKRAKLLEEAMVCLDQCQTHLIHRIQAWRREQHLATIGTPFNEDLGPLQTWCEQLLGVNVKLREEVVLAAQDCGGAEPIRKLQESLQRLLQTLIQSSLIVDKQPPQVIKTQSKFSTSVRFLLGDKVAPGKSTLLKGQIITEAQARNVVQLVANPMDNVGELISNTALLDYNSSNKVTCATFKNMCIKKIKRADRRGSESVTEEKFAIHFSGEVNIVGCDSPCKVQTLSCPIVVIVHGSQDINAMATIVWDCAFSDPDRVPFVVPDRVPWKQMCMTLESKFMSEVQTQRGLDVYNQHFLAQKIFNKPDYSGDFSNMLVTWSQFNKEMLPGRAFTFWQWFDGVLELTKKHLRNYWTDNLIFGFIGKQHLHLILQDRPNGTFLLRFSDSEIGGITIAYIAPSENGGRKIQNIQPFTKKDLEIRSLGDRIRDIEVITHMYPEFPKNNVFKKYYTDEPRAGSSGYIGVSIHTKVADEGCPPGLGALAVTHSEAAQDLSPSPGLPSYPSNSVYRPEASPQHHKQHVFYPGPQTTYQNEPAVVDMSYPGIPPDEHSFSIFSPATTTQSPASSLPDIMDLGLSLLEPDIEDVHEPHEVIETTGLRDRKQVPMRNRNETKPMRGEETNE